MHGPSGRRVGAAEFELSFATQAQATRASQPARILSSTPRNRFAARALPLSDDLNPPSSVANASPASGRPQQGRLPASQSGADRSSRAARTDRRSVRRVRHGHAGPEAMSDLRTSLSHPDAVADSTRKGQRPRFLYTSSPRP